MSTFAKDTVALLERLDAHGPISMEDFKEAYPRIPDPSTRLRKLVAAGVMRRMQNLFVVTDKGKKLLPTKVAQPSEFLIAGMRRIEHKDGYTGQRFTPMRAGADDHLKIPSLISGRRIYRKDSGHAQEI
jgi:hypothetical protein